MCTRSLPGKVRMREREESKRLYEEELESDLAPDIYFSATSSVNDRR